MTFDVEQLAMVIEGACPAVKFAFLFGSSRDGILHDASDVDIAVYLAGKADIDFYSSFLTVVEKVVPADRCDVSVLNKADVVLRFEALKGRCLFVRDMDEYAGFFSLTCRQYEYQMADYERQAGYRKDCLAGRNLG